jgi:hypothetical protein
MPSAHAPRAGLRTRGRGSCRAWPTHRRFPGSCPVLYRTSCGDGFRSHLPLRGSPGFTPGSLLPPPEEYFPPDGTSSVAEPSSSAARRAVVAHARYQRPQLPHFCTKVTLLSYPWVARPRRTRRVRFRSGVPLLGRSALRGQTWDTGRPWVFSGSRLAACAVRRTQIAGTRSQPAEAPGIQRRHRRVRGLCTRVRRLRTRVGHRRTRHLPTPVPGQPRRWDSPR